MKSFMIIVVDMVPENDIKLIALGAMITMLSVVALISNGYCQSEILKTKTSPICPTTYHEYEPLFG